MAFSIYTYGEGSVTFFNLMEILTISYLPSMNKTFARRTYRCPEFNYHTNQDLHPIHGPNMTYGRLQRQHTNPGYKAPIGRERVPNNNPEFECLIDIKTSSLTYRARLQSTQENLSNNYESKHPNDDSLPRRLNEAFPEPIRARHARIPCQFQNPAAAS